MGLTQPKIHYYVEMLKEIGRSFGTYRCPDDLRPLVDEFYSILDRLEPDKRGVHKLWFHAPRGPMRDFGSLKEALEYGDVESKDEFIEAWQAYYPYQTEWYCIDAFDSKDDPLDTKNLHPIRSLLIGHRAAIAFSDEKNAKELELDLVPFFKWLVDQAKSCLVLIENGKYNECIEKNLPVRHRTGTIVRKDFFDIWPDVRERFRKGFTDDDVQEFCRYVAEQPKDLNDVGTLPTMTANQFYWLCSLGYKENGYDGCDLDLKKQYEMHADGRDGGLGEIDLNSPEAYAVWHESNDRCGSHPWEVCRGGNSTHVSLYVDKKEDGYRLILDGNAWSRSIETIRFYLAFRRQRIPVYLNDADLLVRRVLETEKIGIVPDGMFPDYCEREFEEPIFDFMNLPDEDTEQIAAKCTWQKEPSIRLKGDGHESQTNSN